MLSYYFVINNTFPYLNFEIMSVKINAIADAPPHKINVLIALLDNVIPGAIKTNTG